MKKSLVLAMAMALGVTASAYAANPFSDVPAGHWAYDAVNKLAAEFADELDSLGVRVANLEKKADNVKITGQIRASYRSNDTGSDSGRLRTRLFLNGQINEDWTYTGRFENSQYYTDEYNPDDDNIDLNRAYVSGRVGGVKLDAGRLNFKPHTGNVLDAEVDGAKLSYGDNVKVTGYVGKADGGDFTYFSDDRLYIADVSAKIGVVDAYATYYNVNNNCKQEIWNLGVAVPVVKDLKLTAEYMNGDADNADGDNSGYVAGLAYKGAKASTPGSWGIYANYYDMPALTFLANTNDSYNGFMNNSNNSKVSDGFEGYEVGANVALAKNIVAAVKYFDLEAREGDADEQAIWSEVVFTF